VISDADPEPAAGPTEAFDFQDIECPRRQPDKELSVNHEIDEQFQ
jgi:hypothetical protein